MIIHSNKEPKALLKAIELSKATSHFSFSEAPIPPRRTFLEIFTHLCVKT